MTILTWTNRLKYWQRPVIELGAVTLTSYSPQRHTQGRLVPALKAIGTSTTFTYFIVLYNDSPASLSPFYK